MLKRIRKLYKRRRGASLFQNEGLNSESQDGATDVSSLQQSRDSTSAKSCHRKMSLGTMERLIRQLDDTGTETTLPIYTKWLQQDGRSSGRAQFLKGFLSETSESPASSKLSIAPHHRYEISSDEGVSDLMEGEQTGTVSTGSTMNHREGRGTDLLLIVLGLVAVCVISLSAYHIYTSQYAPPGNAITAPGLFRAVVTYWNSTGEWPTTLVLISTPHVDDWKETTVTQDCSSANDSVNDNFETSLVTKSVGTKGTTRHDNKSSSFEAEATTITTLRTDADLTSWVETSSADEDTNKAELERTTHVPRRTRGQGVHDVHAGENVKPTKGCSTETCASELGYIRKYLNWKAIPCRNFYSFVCSRWKDIYPEIGTSQTTLQIQRVEESAYQILTTIKKAKPETLKTAKLFKSCIRKPSVQDKKAIPSDFLASVGLAGWPFIRHGSTLLDVWKSAALLLTNLDMASLVSVNIEVNPEVRNRYIISLGEPTLLIGQYGTKDNNLPGWYNKVITTFVNYYGGGNGLLTRSIREFSGRLAEISVNRGYETFAVRGYKLLKLKHYSYLTQLLTFVFENITSVHKNTMLLIKSELYLKSLRLVLHVNGPDDMLNYMGFRALLHISPLLSEQAMEIAAVEMRQLTGITKSSWPRWQRCLRMLEHVLPEQFWQAYAQNQPAVLSELTLNIVHNIRKSFITMLSDLSWMSASDKGILKRRIKKLNVKEFRSFWTYDYRGRSAAASLSQVTVSGSVVTWYQELVKAFSMEKLSRIRSPRNAQLKEWKGSLFDTEPTVDAASNTVFIPATMFDPSDLSDNVSLLLHLPRVANKMIGAMFRGIHQKSFQSNELKWSVTTEKQYQDLRRCLWHYYEKTYKGKIRYSLISDLDVLDVLSLVPAYKMFLKHADTMSIMNYGAFVQQNVTSRQLFFILLAKDFCETSDAERQTQILQESVQSVSSLRVNSPLRNSHRFATSWNCASDSPMNPKQKCPIWNS